MSGCKTGKTRYRTERIAKAVLTDCLIKQAFNERTKRRERRAYECRFCGGWHLTSKPEKGAA